MVGREGVMQAAPLINSFNSGEWSSDLEGRIDNDYYNSSCASLINFLSRVQGPITKRPGLRFMTRAKYSDKKARLIRFQFSTTQTYILEFGDLYMRVFTDHGAVVEDAKTITGITQASPGVITSAAHGYSDGDWVYISDVVGMTTLNGKTFKVASSTTDTFTLTDLDDNAIDTSAYDAYTSGGTAARIYEIVTPYSEDDLAKLRWTQSADVMFIACSGQQPQTLSRTGQTSWTIEDYDFNDGPYLTQNATSTTITPSGKTGSVTLTASADTFVSTDVGRWVRIKHSSTWGAAQITAYTSAKVVTASVDDAFPYGDTTASSIWRLGLWTDSTWPQAVEFFQNRLYWFTNEQVDGSYSGDYYSFHPTLTDGTVTDACAVQRQLGSRGVNAVLWAVDNEKALLMGTRDGEWVLRANTLGDAITPTNINATKATDFGSYDTQAYRVQSFAVFIQKTGRIICETGYDVNSDGFSTSDLNLFNTSINEGLASEFAYQGHPDNYLYCVQQNGSMSVLTYNPSQQVKGWQRLETAGKIISVASCTAPDATRDEVWMITERKINGGVVKMIEYMDDIFRNDTLQEDGYFVDCGLTYDGRRTPSSSLAVAVNSDATRATLTADSGVFASSDKGSVVGTADGGQIVIDTYTSTSEVSGTLLRAFKATDYAADDWWLYDTVEEVSGLDHLEGEEVAIVGDGAVLVSKTVSGGSVALSSPSSVVHVGLPYTSYLKTSRLNAGAADGTAQGKIKRIDRIVLRLWRSLGGKYGGAESQFLDPISERVPQDPMDRQLELFTGDTDVLDFSGDYTQGAQIVFSHTEPLPCTLVAIMPRVVTQDGR